MKKRIEGMVFFCLFSFGAFFSLSFGCLALKLNYEWQAVFFLMCSLYMMLLVHASIVNVPIKYELEKKTKQEEIENREETRDSGAVEKSASTNAGKN